MSIPSFQAVQVGSLTHTMLRCAAIAVVGATIGACTLLDFSPAPVPVFADGVAGLPEWTPAVRANGDTADLARARPEPKPEAAGPPQAPLGHLLGGAPSDVLAALGKPESSEQTRTAQRWRYAGAGCQVDLLFFFDVAGDRYRLAMISRNGNTVDAASAAVCLAGPSIAQAQS